MTPALVVLAIGLNSSRSLVISQVVLSFGIPFALVPLVIFTTDLDNIIVGNAGDFLRQVGGITCRHCRRNRRLPLVG